MRSDRLTAWMLTLALALCPSLAFAQSAILGFPPGVFNNRAALAGVVASYQGPGDVVSGATAWASCARAYNASYANGTNPLCDLKDKTTGTVAICTLRVATTGFVDLAGSYCTGSTTPALACAAAAGGACIVSKAYDQTLNGNHWTQGTVAAMPGLTFNVLNGLPGLQGTGVISVFLATPAVTINQPMTFVTVSERTGSFTSAQRLFYMFSSGAPRLSYNTATNQLAANAGTLLTATASDSAFHAISAVFSGASSSIIVDGSATTGNAGSSGATAQSITILSDQTSSALVGFQMEVGVWPSGFNATQYGNMSTNMHGTNGYNF